MDEQRLSEIRQRAEAATPGKYTKVGYDAEPYRTCTWRVAREDGINIAVNCSEEDADLFANSKQDIPDLLEYIRKLEMMLDGHVPNWRNAALIRRERLKK
jgi:hypothetical protein